MNKKVWCAGVLALALVALAGCGQKPTAAPDQQQETASDQQVTGSGGDTAAGETGSEGTDNAASSDNGQDQGTGQDQSSSGSQGQGQDSTGQDQSTSSQSTDSSQKNLNIDVYYTDPQELDLHKAHKEISYSSDEEKYKKAFDALQSSDKSDLIPLWGKVELKSMNMKDGQLTMDIHLPDEARLGAGGEQFALDALDNTMFQFDELKSIELLVDGAKVESLMGHVDLEHPMTRH